MPIKVFFFLLFVAGTFCVYAQETPNPFKGKVVGVYLSKKNLKIDPQFNQLISSFIRHNDTVGLSEENLQLALSVKLGEYLTEAFKTDLQADSVFFLNANPVVAGHFIKAYGNGKMNFSALNMPENTDYILVVESAGFYTEKKQTVATYSNKILTQNKVIKKADIYLKVYNLKTKRLAGETIVAYDDEQPRNENQLWDWKKYPTVGEQFIAKVFNLSLFLLFATLNEKD